MLSVFSDVLETPASVSSMRLMRAIFLERRKRCMGKDLTRSVYLIDTENQHDYWMKHIKSNTSNDKVILFCSVNSPRVTFQLMQTLYTSFAPRQVEYVETYPGKNSQDFFIIGKLGQLITTAPKSKYYIVSEDKGYDAYLYSLVEQGYKTFRLEIRLPQSHWL